LLPSKAPNSWIGYQRLCFPLTLSALTCLEGPVPGPSRSLAAQAKILPALRASFLRRTPNALCALTVPTGNNEQQRTTKKRQPLMRFANSETTVESPIFNEVLAVDSEAANVLAYYASTYYAGTPAATLHRKGQGRGVHFGSFFTPENATALLDALAIQDPLAEWADIPAEIQATTRSSSNERFYFLLNFSGAAQTVIFKGSTFDLLGNEKLRGYKEIQPYGVLFVREQ
jgi:beta-galactosidase GanA